MNTNPDKKAFSAVEVILAVSIFSLMVLGLGAGLASTLQSQQTASYQTKANYLAEEAITATESVIKADFSGVTAGTYGISLVANKWELGITPVVIDNFTRQITVQEVDSFTKQIIATVSWQAAFGLEQITMSKQITDWARNTPISNPWGNIYQVATADLVGGNDGYAVTQLNNYVYIARIGGSPDLYSIDITNPQSPNPNGGNFSASGNIFDVLVANGNLYISASSNNRELTSYSLASPASPSFSDGLNLPGGADGSRTATSGNIVYMLRESSSEDEFYSIDISNPNNLQIQDNINFSGIPYGVTLSGSYAYVSTGINSQEVIVVDISNPSLLQIADSYNLPTSQNCRGITAGGSNLAVGCDNGTIYIMDITNPNNISLVTSISAGNARINQLEFVPSLNVMFVGSNIAGAEFQVYDMTDWSNPQLSSTIDAPGEIFDLVYDETRDLVYTATSANNAELTIYGQQ
ncbi:hypothetical protein KC640_00350 [Candidatus Dojkabacteria bacterium]|uniref:Uncharacterized protein n=1 Tax=Candidatus Dojkabacteria bacterium TaxID=2099670 RepID=A0A955KZV7_9BACT|nr:hypothetical protein [Candidatus Dojkabacteria bacterium]